MPRTEHTETHARLVEVNGTRGVILLLLVPLVCSLPLIARRTRIPVAILMLLFSLAGSMTVGLFYLPSTILLLWPEKP